MLLFGDMFVCCCIIQYSLTKKEIVCVWVVPASINAVHISTQMHIHVIAETTEKTEKITYHPTADNAKGSFTCNGNNL